MLFWLTIGRFWCSVVTSVAFSSNLSNFEVNPKNQQQKKEEKKSKIIFFNNLKFKKSPKKIPKKIHKQNRKKNCLKCK